MVITVEEKQEQEEEEEEERFHLYLYFNLYVHNTTLSLSLLSDYSDDDGRGAAANDGEADGGDVDITNAPNGDSEYAEVGGFGYEYEENRLGVTEAAGEEMMHFTHQRRKVELGELFRLKCRPQNFLKLPPLVDFEAAWYFNGQPLQDRQLSHVKIIGRYVLIFTC